MTVDRFDILFHPYVTEKTMFQMDGSGGDPNNRNKLEFIVRREATKGEIKEAFEELFDVKVAIVRTKIAKDGKHAIIKLTEGFSAEDVGMRIGIF